MKKAMDLYNRERIFETTIANIQEDNSILPENKKQIMRFVAHMKVENLSIARITRYLFDLKRIARILGKPFDRATKDDIKMVVGEINGLKLSEATKKDTKILIRKLYCFLRGIEDKGEYPPEVKWIKINLPSNSKKLPEELLTEKEIKEIVRACGSVRDKALAMTLAESGARVSEIGTMCIKHVAFEVHGARLTLKGKTGMRPILVINSAPYLQEWINNHPHNQDSESPLWYNPQKSGFLSHARISHILKRAAQKAGIKKRVYAHLFRHSRATRLAKDAMSDAQLKAYLGWTGGSKMAAIYVHLSGKDVDSAILKMNGVEIKDERIESELTSVECLKCKSTNAATARYCRCGFILNEEEAKARIRAELDRQKADELMNLLLRDKDILELVKRKIKPDLPS